MKKQAKTPIYLEKTHYLPPLFGLDPFTSSRTGGGSAAPAPGPPLPAAAAGCDTPPASRSGHASGGRTAQRSARWSPRCDGSPRWRARCRALGSSACGCRKRRLFLRINRILLLQYWIYISLYYVVLVLLFYCYHVIPI